MNSKHRVLKNSTNFSYKKVIEMDTPIQLKMNNTKGIIILIYFYTSPICHCREKVPTQVYLSFFGFYSNATIKSRGKIIKIGQYNAVRCI
jgi:hypothetical protein